MSRPFVFVGVEPKDFSGQVHCMLETLAVLEADGYRGISCLMPQLERGSGLGYFRHALATLKFYAGLVRSRREGPEFAIVSVGSSTYYLLRAALCILLVGKVPIVLELHTTGDLNGIQHGLLHWMVNRSVRVICLNRIQVANYRLPDAKAWIRANVVRVDEAAAGGGLRPEGVVLGYLSLGAETKGIYEFIDCAATALKKGRADKVLIACPYAKTRFCANSHTQARLFEQVRLLTEQFGERVEVWPNGVTGEEKATFFRRVTHFVFPSRFPAEAMPIAPLEAMAAGCAVIALRSPVLEAVFEDGGSALALSFYNDERGLEALIAGAKVQLARGEGVFPENADFVRATCSARQYRSAYDTVAP